MQINLIYDPSVQSAPSGFTAAMAYAAAQLGNLITNPIIVNIRVGFGEVADSPLAGDVLAEGGPDGGQILSYSDLRSYLAANATTAADQTMLAHLPGSDPTGGGRFYISGAQAKAWGLVSANGTEVDGTVGFSSTATNFNYNLNQRGLAGAYDFVGIAEHELTHALDRYVSPIIGGSQYDVMDLFRYSSSGALQLNAAAGGFFSIDGGATRLNPFDSTSDYGDWGSSVTGDPFAVVVTPGTLLAISSTDQTLMDVLGYTLSGGTGQTPISPASHRSDFDGSGTSGILFHNSNGSLAAWQCRNGVAVAAASFGSLSGGWAAAGTGDFYGSGTDDILFQNTDGSIAQWQMQGFRPIASTVIGVTDLSRWRIVGTGDFFGTGISDVLFRDSVSGTIAEWQVSSGHAIAATTVGVTTPDWTIAAVGNFRGSGTTDGLLFISSAGVVADWDVTNGHAATARVIGQTSAYWSIAGSGDFTGDGQADILFRGQNGEIAMWKMQNGTVTASDVIGQTSADWQIAGLGDYNGDRTSDVLFHNVRTNDVAAWQMNNGRVQQVTAVGASSAGWTILGS